MCKLYQISQKSIQIVILVGYLLIRAFLFAMLHIISGFCQRNNFLYLGDYFMVKRSNFAKKLVLVSLLSLSATNAVQAGFFSSFFSFIFTPVTTITSMLWNNKGKFFFASLFVAIPSLALYGKHIEEKYNKPKDKDSSKDESDKEQEKKKVKNAVPVSKAPKSAQGTARGAVHGRLSNRRAVIKGSPRRRRSKPNISDLLDKI